MHVEPSTFLSAIRFEQERQRRALMTERLLQSGWGTPPATPGRLLRRLLAAVVGPRQTDPRPAVVGNEAGGRTRAALLIRRGTG